MDFQKLSPRELDALREMCNIGAGHAATALSQMIGKTVTLKVPSVRILPFGKVPEIVGGAQVPVVGLFMRIYGDSKGNILLLLPRESAQGLIRLLLGKEPSESFQDNFTPETMEASALKEVGNILASSFLTTIGNLLDIHVVPSVPGIAFDMAGAVLDYVIIELSRVGDIALLIETEFLEANRVIRGHFFLIPDPLFLDVTLKALMGDK